MSDDELAAAARESFPGGLCPFSPSSPLLCHCAKAEEGGITAAVVLALPHYFT